LTIPVNRFKIESVKDVNGFKTMTKPMGGRGKRAPYETTHMRIPLPLKTQIEQLIEDYRLSILEGIESQPSELIPMEEALIIAQKLLRSKTAKNETIAKLLTSIYKTDITKEDLS
jgi:hypothetical protein